MKIESKLERSEPRKLSIIVSRAFWHSCAFDKVYVKSNEQKFIYTPFEPIFLELSSLSCHVLGENVFDLPYHTMRCHAVQYNSLGSNSVL